MSNKQPFSLEKCCEILNNRRKPLNSEQRQHIVGKYPYYGANGVQGYIDDYAFDDDLILIAEDGGYFDEFATRPIAYQVSGKCWVNNHAHVLKAKDDFSQDFIFYSLVHKDINKFIKGGTRAKLNLAELKAIEIEIPDLPTQKRIAKILSTVDGQIEKTAAIIAKYQAIKQGMLHDLFTRGIDLSTGKLRSTPEQLPELYKQSTLGLIPKDWEIYHLRDLLNNVIDNRGKTPPTISNGEIELIETVSISNIELYPDFSKVSKYVTFNTYKNWFRGYIERNDILISTVGEYAGSTALLHKTRGVIGQNLVSLRVNNAYDYFFTYFWTKTPYFSFNLGQVMMSAAQPSLKLPHLLNFKIAIPQIKKESEAIGNSLLHVYNMISSESINLLKLEKLKQGLMSKLLNGDV